jgi:polysaccharide biosynthesis protein VpsM
MKKRLLVLLAVSMSFLLFSYHSSFAGEGKIVLKPHINVSWQSDSNFWWAEEDEKEVYTYLVQPGVTFGYETDKTKIHLDYTLNGYLYSDQDPPSPGIQKASDDNYIGHTLNLDISTRQLDQKLLAGVREDFYLTRDQAQSDAFNNSAVRNKYFINRVEPFAFYDFSGRLTAGVRYRNTITDYTEENSEDSTENRGLFDLIYHFSETSSLDLDYQIWARDYSKRTSAYLSNQVMLAYQQQFRFVSLEAAAGYQYRSFEKETLESMDIVPWRLGVELATAPEAISPLLPEEQKKSYVRLMLAQDFNNQGLGEGYFKADRITLGASHIFLERIPVRINGFYQRSKYKFWEGETASGSTEKRDDDTYKVYCSIGYKFLRWFTLSIEPGYEKRSSNIVGRSYEDKVIMAQLVFLYDVGGK